MYSLIVFSSNKMTAMPQNASAQALSEIGGNVLTLRHFVQFQIHNVYTKRKTKKQQQQKTTALSFHHVLNEARATACESDLCTFTRDFLRLFFISWGSQKHFQFAKRVRKWRNLCPQMVQFVLRDSANDVRRENTPP